MIVLGLTGHMGAGKDAVADYLVAKHGFTKLSFATPLKDMVEKLDPYIDREGTRLSHVLAEVGSGSEAVLKAHFPEVRRVWQVLGTDCIRAVDPTFWVRQAMAQVDRINDPYTRVVFADTRFPNEGKAIHNYGRLVGGCFAVPALWQIVRPGFDGDGHESEKWVGKMNEDDVIHNIEGLAQLGYVVDLLMEELAEHEDVAING